MRSIESYRDQQADQLGYLFIVHPLGQNNRPLTGFAIASKKMTGAIAKLGIERRSTLLGEITLKVVGGAITFRLFQHLSNPKLAAVYTRILEIAW
ncbi:hypothetical protein [Leptolyngbya iicbica]|uniref:Uncharacterized protein n=2 Tax=Cyanophyceae TaxID=3028117 RepID=A0A4Q7E0K4_9CYAN|nr:hypothetical protein [Leptolyngbya sp. LK]RZM74361.1 hypothetical protein DYY88_23700 [Leptolyngbya sp. LK]